MTSEFLQEAASATSNERVLQQVTFAMSNEWFYSEQQATKEFQQRATSKKLDLIFDL